MLFEIKRNPMHPLSGEFHCRMCRRVLLVFFWLLIGTRSRLLSVELLSIAEPLCLWNEQGHKLWNDLSGNLFDGVGLVGFKIRANASL